MGFLLAYSIKSAIILSVIFAIYLLTARRVKGASLRRALLIGIYIGAAILPLLDINLFPAESTPIALRGTRTQGQQPTAIILSTSPTLLRTLGQILVGGIILLLIQLMATFIHVAYLHLKGRSTSVDGIDVTVLDRRSFSPFCFGKRIFVSQADFTEMTASDGSETPRMVCSEMTDCGFSLTAGMVLCHEKSHIRRRHFIDLLFARLVTIMQWWNPLAWLMLRELQDVHEFQADEDVINSGHPLREYQYLLLNRTAGRIIPNPVPSHGIRYSRLRHRLKMLNKEQSTRATRASSLLLIPALATALLIISSPLISPLLLSASRTSFTTIKLPIDDKSSEPEYQVNGLPVSPTYIKSLSPTLIESMTVRKDSPDYPNGLIEIQLKTDEIPDLQPIEAEPPAETLDRQPTEAEPPAETLDEILVVARATSRPGQPAQTE